MKRMRYKLMSNCVIPFAVSMLNLLDLTQRTYETKNYIKVVQTIRKKILIASEITYHYFDYT